jgi:carboxyl-terminal processing protease
MTAFCFHKILPPLQTDMLRKSFLLFLLFSFPLVFNEDLQAQKKRPTVIKRPKVISTVTVKAIPEPEVSTKNLTPAQRLRLESFRVVWQTINEHYFDRNFNGLNWQKLKYENELKVVKFETDEQLYDLLETLVGRLNSSHFAIIPPEFLQEIQKIKVGSESENEDSGESVEDDSDEEDANEFLEFLEAYDARYGIGAEVRLFGKDVIITRIDKNSAAEKAGLKIGDKIEQINGVSLAEFIARMEAIENYETKYKKQVPVYIQTLLFNGEKDSAVSLTYNDGQQKSKEISIKREKLDGEMVETLLNMPRQFLQFETKSLSDEIGYVRFNVFTVSAAEKLCAALTELKNKKSLIIDLRGNLGGSFGALFGIAGLLTDKNIVIGTEISKSGEHTHLIKPHLKNFKGNLVVLVDNLSVSAAEILTAALQESGRAIVVGETSGGEALPSIFKPLPTGAVFQYPISNFKTPKGKILEGRGVTPDVSVARDKTRLANGIDDQIESAVGLLKKNEASIVKVEEKKFPPPPPPKSATLPATGISNQNNSVAVKEQYDQAAIAVIEKYINAVGGAEALRKLKSVSAEGAAEIMRGGTSVSGGLHLTKQSGRYAENYNFTGVGDIIEIFDGEKLFVQTQVNGVQEFDLPAKNAELRLESDFLEFVNLRANYKLVKFLGNFERLGERVNLIEVKNAESKGFVLAFDAKTNLLVSRIGQMTGTEYGDYRKVGEYLFPFKISKAGIVNIEFYEIQTNIEVKDEVFSRKISCFDKVD